MKRRASEDFDLMEADLPSAAKRPKDPKPNVHYATIEKNGKMYLGKFDVDLAAHPRSAE